MLRRMLVALLALTPGVALADPATVVFILGASVDIAGIAITVKSILLVTATVIGSAAQRRKVRKEAARRRAAYNANLQDRNVTLLQALPAWRVVYGRSVCGGDIVDVLTSDKQGTREDGTAYTKPDAYKHLVIHVASHEVQDIHEIYVDGIGVGPVDANGWATTGEFFATRLVNRTVTFTTSVTLTQPVVAVLNSYESAAGSEGHNSMGVTLSNGNLTITAATPGVSTTVDYTANSTQSSVRWSKHLGTSSQTVDAYLNAILPDQQTTDHRGRGVAYIVVTLDLENQRFQGGPPSILADVSGKKVYDQRKDSTAGGSGAHRVNDSSTWEWSSNPALCIRDWLVSPWGYECEASEIDGTYLMAGANACDVAISLTVNGVTTTGQPTYTLNGSFTTDEGKEQVLEEMCEAMAGDAVYGAQWMIIPGAWTPPVTLPGGGGLTDDDLDGQIEVVQAGAPIDDLFNGVRGSFIEATVARGSGSGYVSGASYTSGQTLIQLAGGSGTVLAGNALIFAGDPNQYVVASGITGPGSVTLEAPGLLKALAISTAATVVSVARSSAKELEPYQNSTFVTADGRELWSNVEYRFTDNAARARNLSRINTERARSSQVIRYPAKLRAFPLQIGDRIQVTSAEYGFSAKTYRVTDWQFGISAPVSLLLQEDAASVYDLADAATSDPTPNTGLTNPAVVPVLAPNTPNSGTSALLRHGDGSIEARVFVSWPAITDPYVVEPGGHIVIRWRRNGSLSWDRTEVPGADTGTYLLGVAEGDFLVIEYVVVNSLGLSSSPVYQGHTVVGKTALPGNASGFTATVEQGGVRFDWTRNSEADVQGRSELHREAVWSDATAPLFDGDANTWFWRSPPLGTHTVLLKHRDTSGNRSAAAASVTVTVDTWSGQQPGNNLIDPSQWVVGTTGTQGQSPRRFVSISAGEDSIVQLAAPDGALRPVWYSQSGDTTPTGDADGGWDTDDFAVDHLKQYRFHNWVRCSGVMDSYAFLGVGLSTVRDIGGGVNSNPYFIVTARNALVSGRWYLMVGYVLPSGYSGAQQNMSGLYDGVTGQKVASGTDYRWVIGQASSAHRAYQYGASNGAQQANWFPGVYLCDGSEPTLGELLAVSMSGRIEAAASVALVARGNCQVVGNTASKPNGSDAWDSDVYSRDSYTGGCFASCVPSSAGASNCMFGLNSDPTTDQSYTSLDYAFQFWGSNNWEIFESGASVAAGTRAANDVFAVAYDGSSVRYSKNGTVLRQIAAPLGLNLFLDTSFYAVASSLSNIQFGPLNTRPRDGEIINFRATQTWDFLQSEEGWSSLNNTSIAAGTSSITVTATGSDPFFQSPPIAIVGGLFDKVRVRVRRTGGTSTSWDGTLYYETAGHSYSASYRKRVTLGPGAGFEVIEWDMGSVEGGGSPSDWVNSVITRIRPDFGAAAGDEFEIDWISIGKNGSAGDPTDQVNLVLIPGASGRGAVTGTTAVKLTSANTWDWHVYSRHGYQRGVAAEAVPAQADKALMFGLNSDPTTDESYTSIDYAIFCVADGTLQAYLSGTYAGAIGTYVAGDHLAVIYDGAAVRWLKNGSVLHSVALVGSTTTFYFDSSFHTIGAALRNIRFGSMSGVFGIDTQQVQPNAATQPYKVEVNSDSVTMGFGVTDRTFSPITIVNSASESYEVEISATGQRTLTTPSGLVGTADLLCFVGVLNVTDSLLVGTTQDYLTYNIQGQGASQTNTVAESTVFNVSIPAGKTYRFTPYARTFSNVASTGTMTLATNGYSLRAAVIKR